VSAPFVGRKPELDAILAVQRRAQQDGAPSAAFVTGEPGTGKSRLLIEILGRADTARSVRLVGFEPTQAIPLAAVSELLRRLAKVPLHGATLQGLVFGARETSGGDPLRIFEAAHRAVAAFGPLLLVVDDLQWVDERSVALLHYLLRAGVTTGQQLVVIAAARPSPGGASFRAGLEAELPLERRVVVELGSLSLEDGLSLARSLDLGIDDSAATKLWRRAGGSPFWLVALTQAREAADPASIIGERLRSLGNDAGALLAALAVSGRPFPIAEMGDLLQWEPERVRHAARELVARGLAVEAGGSIWLAHDLIREAALDDLPAAVRRRLHARLAESIEAGGAGDLSMLYEALQHRAAAGLPTTDLVMELLSSPQRRLLGTESLQLMASISDALEPGGLEQLRIDQVLGELAAVLGDQELALDRWRHVAERSHDASERQHAFVEAARAAYRLRRAGEAHAHLNSARASAPATPETGVSVASLQAEIELWLDHETAAGSGTAQEALAAALELAVQAGGAERLSPTARRASLAAYDAAIDAALQEDRAGDVLRLSEASALVAEGLDDESYLASVIRPAFGLRPLGRVREAEERYRHAWTLSKQLVLPAATVEAGHGLARTLRDLGRLAEAHAVASETVQLEGRMGHPPRRWGNAPSILHWIELALGDLGALSALRRDAAAEPDPHYRLAVHQIIAAWLARLHGPRSAKEVVAELTAARSAAAMAGCPRCGREVAVYAAEALARVGLVEDARRELAAWEANVTSDYLMQRVWGTRARAAIAVASGDDAGAISLLNALIGELEPEGLIEDLLWAHLDLGSVLARVDRGRSVEEYSAAAALAEQTGALSQGRIATQALRRLGVRAWRRGRAAAGDGLAALTAREREVARLVAGGDSNREIAEALFVSPKTIERHITNVLAKLGLRNRTELATLVRSSSVRGSPDE
jgi:DNA-binding CsgD family transcriptional regulator